jgi:hypothetical protein
MILPNKISTFYITPHPSLNSFALRIRDTFSHRRRQTAVVLRAHLPSQNTSKTSEAEGAYERYVTEAERSIAPYFVGNPKNRKRLYEPYIHKGVVSTLSHFTSGNRRFPLFAR